MRGVAWEGAAELLRFVQQAPLGVPANVVLRGSDVVATADVPPGGELFAEYGGLYWGQAARPADHVPHLPRGRVLPPQAGVLRPLRAVHPRGLPERPPRERAQGALRVRAVRLHVRPAAALLHLPHAVARGAHRLRAVQDTRLHAAHLPPIGVLERACGGSPPLADGPVDLVGGSLERRNAYGFLVLTVPM